MIQINLFNLNFKIDWPSVIARLANAEMKDTDLYVGNKRKAFKGRALVIRSNHSVGDIKLKDNDKIMHAEVDAITELKN